MFVLLLSKCLLFLVTFPAKPTTCRDNDAVRMFSLLLLWCSIFEEFSQVDSVL